MASIYHDVDVHSTIQNILCNGDTIITTTASTKAIINAADIKYKTHIIALGADEICKQEWIQSYFK